MLSFKPAFSLLSFTFIKRLHSSSSLSARRVVSSAYLRLLIFVPAILIPACDSKYSNQPALQTELGICPRDRGSTRARPRPPADPGQAACCSWPRGPICGRKAGLGPQAGHLSRRPAGLPVLLRDEIPFKNLNIWLLFFV